MIKGQYIENEAMVALVIVQPKGEFAECSDSSPHGSESGDGSPHSTFGGLNDD